MADHSFVDGDYIPKPGDTIKVISVTRYGDDGEKHGVFEEMIVEINGEKYILMEAGADDPYIGNGMKLLEIDETYQ